MGWSRYNVTADEVGARRAVDTGRRSHRLAALTFTAFLVSVTVAGFSAHAGTTGTPGSRARNYPISSAPSARSLSRTAIGSS